MNSNEANQKLDELLCPFEGVPEFTVLGQGCDTIDQNCNGVRDECAEDKVPPTIELKVPLPDTPFKSNIDALAFLSTNVIVSDDCAVKFQTDFQLLTVSDVDCCDCEFQVTTEDERCVNDNNPGTAATASRTFLLKVDRAAPVISCGFFTQQDPLHVAQGFDACEDLPVPFPGDNDPLHVDQACFGQGLFDVRLWYQIEDECDDGVLPVTVRVLSNEFSEEKMTLIVERNDLPNMVHRAQVYISPISCQDMSTGGSGGSKGKAREAKAALVLDIEISNKEDSNGAIEFEYTETTHDNVIEAHRKLDSIRRGVDEANVKLDEAIRKLDSIQEGLNEANQKLDELLCPFEGVPEFTVLGQGCDTIDQNCNGVRDECAEDKVPPTIELKVPLPDTPFKSNIDALAFLSTNVIVSDDCAVKFQTDFQLLTVSDVDCCDCEFQVTTEDERCVNDNNPGTAATASRTFLLKVDRAAPVISCGFFTQQDPLHVAQGFDACEDLPVPFPGDNDPLHVDQACFGQGLFDVRLWYQIEDECDDGVLPVTVRVLSNEFSEEKMTLIVERNDLPNMVHRAQVYISPISCQDMSTGGSGGSKGKGQSKSTICEVEETENDSVTTRFYDVVISASDAAGNVGTKTCSVIVIPANHYCGDAECGSKGSKSTKNVQNDVNGRNLQVSKKKSKALNGRRNDHNPDDLRLEYLSSTQRYVLSELSLEWDQKLNTGLVVPELSPVLTGKKANAAKKGQGKGSKTGQQSCPIICEETPGGDGGKKANNLLGGVDLTGIGLLGTQQIPP
ncbi:hypothetical protein IV203_038772 [Nitzschia inconspicua]|uniref:Uncharacterized protein n=1 Tax=Nitzschia inconspicua TaxID=303405 RepID=A0A9K3LPH7_9STRA|nr:hypothetical protein IV203_038772 [Nitzschia inconspicua]